jgi:hypothetical protein
VNRLRHPKAKTKSSFSAIWEDVPEGNALIAAVSRSGTQNQKQDQVLSATC